MIKHKTKHTSKQRNKTKFIKHRALHKLLIKRQTNLTNILRLKKTKYNMIKRTSNNKNKHTNTTTPHPYQGPTLLDQHHELLSTTT